MDNFLLRLIIWLLCVCVWIFSAGFDGRFIAGLMPPTLAGQVFGYGLNLTVDVINVVFSYLFAKLQRERRGSKVWRWSFVLLAGELIGLYFGTVFSWATIVSMRPELAPWLAWSAAFFAQASLLFLGVGQALVDVRIEAEQRKREGPTSTEPPKPKALACPVCGVSSTRKGAPILTQAQLSGHMRAHSNKEGLTKQNKGGTL